MVSPISKPEKKEQPPVIVIVDDDSLVTTALRSFLEVELNCRVITFQSADRALKMIQTIAPDLVISDYLMPEMNGLQFLSEVKKRYPDVPRILLTAYGDKENAVKGINEVGLYQFVEKPWDNENLKLIIKNGLAQKSLQNALEEKRIELDRILRQRDELFRLNNLLQQELTFARQVQHKFLPPKEIHVNGILVAAQYLPTLEIGGDYFDVLPLSESRTAVVLADLTGHGIQASLCTALLKFAFSAFKGTNATIEEIIRGMNDVLFKGLPSDIFAATLLILFDNNKKIYELINGGLPHPLILHRKKSEIERVFANGFMLGMVDNEVFRHGEKVTLQLQPEDSLFLFSDGLTEAKNQKEEFFGEHSLQKLILSQKEKPGKEIIARLAEEVRKFQTPATLIDDITILSIEVSTHQSPSDPP